MMSARGLLSAAVVAIMLECSAAYARDEGLYLGGAIGRALTGNSACSDAGSGFSTFSCESRNADTGWKIFAGYQLSRYVAAEASYVSLGEFKVSASGNFSGPPALGQSMLTGSDKPTGFSLDAVGTLPIDDRFGLIGRVGIFAWTLDSSASISGTGGSISSGDKPTGTSLDFGVGAKYDFGGNIGVRAEFQRYKNIGNDTTGKSDVDLFSVSVLYAFR